MTDPIADMLTRIRNASAVKKAEILLPMSKMKHKIALILKEEGWIYDVDIVKASTDSAKSAFDQLKIVLKYKKSGRSVITSIRRISKPGLRSYSKKLELPRVLNNFGIAIVSTSKGLMTNKQARKEGLGGEVICEIY